MQRFAAAVQDLEYSGVPDKTCTHLTQELHSGIRCLGTHEILIEILIEILVEIFVGAASYRAPRRGVSLAISHACMTAITANVAIAASAANTQSG